MKISEVLSTKFSELMPSQRKTESADFEFTLKKLDEEGLAERLSGLIENITDTGKRLSEHMDLKDLRHYRSLVGEFMNEVVTNSHKFSRENFLDHRGRHRVYAIVKLVNKDLDDLAKELLKSEKDRIAILDKVDEINGLLLDILA